MLAGLRFSRLDLSPAIKRKEVVQRRLQMPIFSKGAIVQAVTTDQLVNTTALGRGQAQEPYIVCYS